MIVIGRFLSLMLVMLFSGCALMTKNKAVGERKKYMCPKVIIVSNDNFELTKVESQLICGAQDNEAYKVIPSYQAAFLLKGYFQNLGYSNVRFEFEEDFLRVYPNEKI